MEALVGSGRFKQAVGSVEVQFELACSNKPTPPRLPTFSAISASVSSSSSPPLSRPLSAASLGVEIGPQPDECQRKDRAHSDGRQFESRLPQVILTRTSR